MRCSGGGDVQSANPTKISQTPTGECPGRLWHSPELTSRKATQSQRWKRSHHAPMLCDDQSLCNFLSCVFAASFESFLSITTVNTISLEKLCQQKDMLRLFEPPRYLHIYNAIPSSHRCTLTLDFHGPTSKRRKCSHLFFHAPGEFPRKSIIKRHTQSATGFPTKFTGR